LHENPAADSFQVVLYGSLAKTGIGHGTDAVIKSVFPRVEIVCDESTQSLPHPNTMDLFAFLGHKEIARMRIYSVGGGSIRIEGRSFDEGADVYTLQNFSEIRRYCERNGLRLSDYVFASEGPNIKEYLSHIWQAMKSAISAGLKAQGVLPGGLGVERKARFLYRQKHIDEIDGNERKPIGLRVCFCGERTERRRRNDRYRADLRSLRRTACRAQIRTGKEKFLQRNRFFVRWRRAD